MTVRSVIMAERKVYITKRMTFEACHHLNNYEGKCSKLHGHSYKLEVTFVGSIDPDIVSSNTLATEAMVCDFTYAKNKIKEVINDFDHANLNDFFLQPTVEIMAVHIYDKLSDSIPPYKDFKVYSVKLWETEDSYAEYRGE